MAAQIFRIHRTDSATRIFRKIGSGPEELFAGGKDVDSMAQYPTTRRSTVIFSATPQSSPRGYDLVVVPLSGDATRSAFLASPANEVQARFTRTAGGSRTPPMNQVNSRSTFVRFPWGTLSS